MANINFEIHGERGGIAVTTYKKAMNLAFGILTDFDTGITGVRHGGLRWYIQSLQERSSGLVLSVYSKERDTLLKRADKDPSPRIANAFVTGFDDLENRVVTPPYLSEFGMIKAQGLVDLIGRNGASGFSVATEEKSVEITNNTHKHIAQLLPTRQTAIGSIEGTLEKISVHRKPQFVVYHAISKRAITCEVPHASFSLMELVKNALGKRVIVSGVLQKNFKGETMRVKVNRLRPLGRLHLVTQTDDQWEDPEFSNAENTAEMLRRIRGA